MRFGPVLLYVYLAFHADYSAAQSPGEAIVLSEACFRLNERALTQMGNGEIAAAEKSLSAALAGSEGIDAACAGIILNNMASAAFVSGRAAEGEMLAERAVHAMEQTYSPDNPVLLRPLHLLAGTRFEQGKIAKARAALSRMQSIRAERPEDRALVHNMNATLLCAEGRWREAESEYRMAIAALEEAGRGESADAGSVFCALGTLYTKERRWRDAGQALDRSLSIVMKGKDVTPTDRIGLFKVRATWHARQHKWREAGEDLEEAVSVANREPPADLAAFRSLLADHAYVLRRNHRRSEAAEVEARVATLPMGRVRDAVVDVSELLAEKKGRRK